MSELTRTTLGFRLPDDVREGLASAQMQLRRRAGSESARWTPAHELYLTLCPLGELSAATLARIPHVIGPAIAQFPPLQISVEGLGGSPSPTQPRLLWAGISGDVERLERLHEATERSLAPLGMNREVHKFAPNILLGRLRAESEIARSELGRALRMTQLGVIGSWTATQVDLLKGDVGPYGPTTVSMGSFPLGAM